jgi:hypothetical protein
MMSASAYFTLSLTSVRALPTLSMSSAIYAFAFLVFAIIIVRGRPSPITYELVPVRIGGAPFFLFLSRSVSTGVPLETLSPFSFSSDICSRDMPREQQLQIPPKEVTANPLFFE